MWYRERNAFVPRSSGRFRLIDTLYTIRVFTRIAKFHFLTALSPAHAEREDSLRFLREKRDSLLYSVGEEREISMS